MSFEEFKTITSFCIIIVYNITKTLFKVLFNYIVFFFNYINKSIKSFFSNLTIGNGSDYRKRNHITCIRWFHNSNKNRSCSCRCSFSCNHSVFITLGIIISSIKIYKSSYKVNRFEVTVSLTYRWCKLFQLWSFFCCFLFTCI